MTSIAKIFNFIALTSIFTFMASSLLIAGEASAVKEASVQSPWQGYGLGVSFGFGMVSRSQQNWRGSGASDIKLSTAPLYSLFGLPGYATLGYAAFDVVAVAEDESHEYFYKGSVEKYSIGTGLSYLVSSQVMVRTELSLGLLNLRMRAQNPEGLDGDHSVGSLGPLPSLALSSNLQWRLSEKVGIGPLVAMSIGTVTTRQVGVFSEFIL
jgi:hypothetical protein